VVGRVGGGRTDPFGMSEVDGVELGHCLPGISHSTFKEHVEHRTVNRTHSSMEYGSQHGGRNRQIFGTCCVPHCRGVVRDHTSA